MLRTVLSQLRLLFAALVTVTFLTAPLAARADGIVIIDPPPPCNTNNCPTPPPCEPLTGCNPCPLDFPCPRPTPFPVGDQLEIKYHRVTVTIENQIATTKVDQLFANPNDWQAEGMYVFPIPKDASVDHFAMWVDGQKIDAKILTAEEAKQIYTEIVRKQRDPALLEYLGQGAVQTSVFPIPPGGERRIQLEYSQVLAADKGLIHYIYPLNTEKFSSRPLDEVSITVNVKSNDAVRAVYSPTHKIALDRPDAFNFTASYEAQNVTPDQNFELFYSVSTKDIGLNLITYRDPASGDGFFVLLAAPGIEIGQEVIAKDVILVLDQSGSMQGHKIEQAKSALTYVLQHLNPDDRFNIVAFSTGTQQFADGLQPASQAGAAADWVSGLEAEGGTNIERALLEATAMSDQERPTILIFLTDGLPTSGVTDSAQILNDVNAAAPANVRLFSFGVGDDVDTILLDSLSEENHGASAYVRPKDDIAETVSAFYDKVQAPVLADVTLDFGGLLTTDVYPEPLPDLFAGSQLVVVGRYRNGGKATVTLKGQVNGESQRYIYADQSFKQDGGSDFIPRLWATRKIGYLLNQIRLKGEDPEMVKAIVDLSVRYGIVTPYTSYLITEPDVLSSSNRDQIAAAESLKLQNAPAPASGGAAVDASVAQGALQSANTVDAPVDPAVDGAAQTVKYVGMRTFLNVDGVWIDTQFDRDNAQTIKVQFGSDDYLALAAARPELASAFALGQRVIVVLEGKAYEVTVDKAAPVSIPPTSEPTAPATDATSVPSDAATPTAQVQGTVIPLGVTVAPDYGALGLWLAVAAGLLALGIVVWFRRRK